MAGQIAAGLESRIEGARRRDAIPAMLVSPAAASDVDVRLLASRWLPLPLDRVQPGAYDLSSGRFLGKRTLFQGTPEDGPRGSITFGEGRTLVRLFENADLSTVLHESGHLFFEVMQRLEKRPEASDRPGVLGTDYGSQHKSAADLSDEHTPQ